MSKRSKNTFSVPFLRKKILGLDIGHIYIGVAIGSADVKLANPVGVCVWKSDRVLFTAYLAALLEEQPIDKVVIGVIEHQRNARVEKAIKAIVEIIEQDFLLPVIFVDEHVSTQEAENRLALVEEDLSTLRTTRKDAIAAQILLERYFEACKF